MPGTTTAALCPVDVMNRAYGSRTAPGTLEPETIRKRHRHGQVFTPYHVSKEAAATLDLKANATGTIHILDAGAGDGQLTLATLDRIGREPEATRPRQIYLTAVEADTELADANEKNLNDIETWCKERHMNVGAAVVREDFLSPRRWRCRSVNVNAHIPIDTCIMNPPYRRTRNADPETRTIRLAGAATSANLYSAFCEIGWRNLQAGGQITATTPRSFQNGSTFAEFRRRLEADVDIDCIHIWQNRRTLYGVQNVIQETVCWHGTVTKGTPRRPLTVIAHGNHERQTTWRWRTPGDRKWIRSRNDGDTPRLMTNSDRSEEALNDWGRQMATIENEDYRVETGRHIEYRHSGTTTEANDGALTPYLSAQHISPNRVLWPLTGSKNYYDAAADPRPLKVHEPDAYVLVNRIAPNELEPRAQACAISSETTNNQAFVASDRVNVISLWAPAKADGSNPAERANPDRNARAATRNARARGLAAWINSSVGNTLIGSALGSTQINASDLRAIPVPPIQILDEIGRTPPDELDKITTMLRSMMNDEAHNAATQTDQLQRVRRRLRDEIGTPVALRRRNDSAHVDGPQHRESSNETVQRNQRARPEDDPREVRPPPGHERPRRDDGTGHRMGSKPAPDRRPGARHLDHNRCSRAADRINAGNIIVFSSDASNGRDSAFGQTEHERRREDRARRHRTTTGPASRVPNEA